MADKMPLKELKHYIPGLIRYRFSMARHHQLLHSRGVVPSVDVVRRLKVDYASMVFGEWSRVPTTGYEDAESGDAASPSGCDPLQMGWVLKVAKKSSKFTTAQKKYFSQQFFIGEERGKKADPKEVALDMRHARDENGARIFVGKDLLSSQQIAGFFSCLATKVRNSSPSVEPYESDDESEDQNDDQKAAEAETRLSDLHGLVERDAAFRRTPNRLLLP